MTNLEYLKSYPKCYDAVTNKKTVSVRKNYKSDVIYTGIPDDPENHGQLGLSHGWLCLLKDNVIFCYLGVEYLEKNMMDEPKPVKQVIVMRTDTNPKMRKGKMIAQGAHSSMAFLAAIAQEKEDLTDVQRYWLENSFRKICVQVDSEEELVMIHEEAIAAGLVSHLITDSGATEFNGVPTKTCCCIGPDLDEKIDKITGGLKLL
jgi:PTH2 family peptidyl-tRNA hydrolase